MTASTDSNMPTENDYDQVPYPQMTHAHSHPRHLEAIATLFGMRPEPVPNARVLELGCASGTNLMPIALDYPESQCLGIDLSERQIADGQLAAKTLGLENLELRHADMMEIDASWGRFDYILCHGVYSWVAPAVQEKILAICKENLASRGVAMVSYNVLPGWHFRGMIRDLMLYHTAQFDQPGEKVSQARAIVKFMAENCVEETPYGQMFRGELESLCSADDDYLIHDHLERENNPVYFSQFVERAAGCGLQYLGDTKFASMLPRFVSEGANEALKNAPLVKQEQYMDFLRNRTFRRTLLCHQTEVLTRGLTPRVLQPFQIVLASRPSEVPIDLADRQPLDLSVGDGRISTNSPAGKAAIAQLIESWPRAVSLDELRQQVIERLRAASLAPDSQSGLDQLPEAMLNAFICGALDVYIHPPRVAADRAACPRASRLAQQQAACGPQVTNQRHEMVNLDPLSLHVLERLGGDSPWQQLRERIIQEAVDGRIPLARSGQPTADMVTSGLPEMVDRALVGLDGNALLCP